MKVLNITHKSDMDGRGCEILTRLVFNNSNIILTEPSKLYDVINELINNKNYLEYDHIFITDLAVKEATALLIDKYLKDKVNHIDHHITEINNKYKWSYTVEEINDFEVCATYLYYNYLKDNFYKHILSYNSLQEIVEAIRCQDTYTFVKYNNTLGPDLTTVFSNSIDEDIYISSIIDRIKNNKDNFKFSNKEIMIIDNAKKELNDYLKECEKRLIIIDFLEYKVGLSISTKYRSIVGNTLSSNHPELDFILIADFNREKFSARTIHDNIDLNVICTRLGGGGHPKASGFDMTSKNLDLIRKYIKNIDKNNLF